MTDSILRSGGMRSWTTAVVGPPPPPITFASLLLAGETDGFAIEARDVSGVPAFVGAPFAGWVSIKVGGTLTTDNKPLDLANITNAAGTSPKVVQWNSVPNVRWAPHNLALQSQALDNAAWTSTAITITPNDTTAPDNTASGDKLVESNTATSKLQETSSVAILSGFVYTISFYIKASNIQWCFLNFADDASLTNGVGQYFDLTNLLTGTVTTAGTGWTFQSASVVDALNGWRRISLTVLAGAATSFISLRSASADNSTTRVSSGTYWAWGAQRVRGYNTNPYMVSTSAAVIGVPQSYDPLQSVYGIERERPGTNLLLRSEQFDNASWTKTGGTVTADAATAPDNSSTADLFFATSSGADAAFVTQNINITSTQNMVFSVYAKGSSWRWLELCIDDGTKRRGWFDLTNGVIGTMGASVTGVIYAVGNGWYRCAITFSSTSVTPNCTIFPVDADNSTTVTASGSNGVYLWGAQGENQAAFASSYIPTLGATQSRIEDDLRCTSVNVGPPVSEWCDVRLQAKHPASDTVTWGIALDDGTANEAIWMYYENPNMAYQVRDGGAAQTVRTHNIGTLTTARHKFAYYCATNHFNFADDGNLNTEDTLGTVPTVTITKLGNTAVGGYSGSSWIYRAVMVPRKYSDSELTSLTT